MPQNPLFRLLAWNWLAGAGAAVTLLIGLIGTNAMHLRDLIFSSEDPVIPIMLLLFGFLITFCSVAMGTAIMSVGEESGGGGGGRRSKASTDEAHLDGSSRRGRATIETGSRCSDAGPDGAIGRGGHAVLHAHIAPSCL